MSGLPNKRGWYNDPEGVHKHQAYWDGERWTGRTRKHKPWEWVAVAALVAVLLVVGYVLLLLLALSVGGM